MMPWMILTLSLLLVPAPAIAERMVPETAMAVEYSFAPVVRKVAPAVVNIYTRKTVRTRQVAPLFDDPFFRRFFGQDFGGLGVPRSETRVQNSLGSGVIMGSDGVIVTNHHVIEGADEIRIVLHDRREFEAQLIGSDERTDLAVLRVDTGGEPLPFLDTRDSDDMEVGDLVLAVGNPFGVGQTVTSGIISGLARSQTGISDIGSFIQTDAAINPGNSGGALVGTDGRLVGINTAIFSKSGGSMGIGFATPSNMVRVVVAGILSGGRVVRPWIGAEGQAITPELASTLGLKRPVGVLVNRVHGEGAAARAGLKVGDVILEIKGRTVESPQDMRFRIATLGLGDVVDMRIWRLGRAETLKLSLTPPPEVPPRDETELSGRHPLEGAVLVNVSPALAEEVGMEGYDPGVLVLKVRRGGNADRFGVQPMDRIVSVNGMEAESVGNLKKIMAVAADGWRIVLRRGGRNMELVVRR